MTQKDFESPTFSNNLIDKWSSVRFMDLLSGVDDSVARRVLAKFYESFSECEPCGISAADTSLCPTARLIILKLSDDKLNLLDTDFAEFNILHYKIAYRVISMYKQGIEGVNSELKSFNNPYVDLLVEVCDEIVAEYC